MIKATAIPESDNTTSFVLSGPEAEVTDLLGVSVGLQWCDHGNRDMLVWAESAERDDARGRLLRAAAVCNADLVFVEG